MVVAAEEVAEEEQECQAPGTPGAPGEEVAEETACPEAEAGEEWPDRAPVGAESQERLEARASPARVEVGRQEPVWKPMVEQAASFAEASAEEPGSAEAAAPTTWSTRERRGGWSSLRLRRSRWRRR